MNRKQVDGIWLGISIFSFLLLSISFLLMPLGSELPSERISGYTLVSGLMFWISIIVGIAAQCVLAHRRKAWFEIHRVRKVKATQRIGLISFFKNAYAAIADIVAIVSLIGLIIAMVVTQGIGYICYVLIALFTFSFSMHCILNGRIYHYVINQNKLSQAIEKEIANSSK